MGWGKTWDKGKLRGRDELWGGGGFQDGVGPRGSGRVQGRVRLHCMVELWARGRLQCGDELLVRGGLRGGDRLGAGADSGEGADSGAGAGRTLGLGRTLGHCGL